MSVCLFVRLSRFCPDCVLVRNFRPFVTQPFYLFVAVVVVGVGVVVVDVVVIVLPCCRRCEPEPRAKKRKKKDLLLNLRTSRSFCNQTTLSCCLTSTEARWPIRDGDRVGRGRASERLDRGNRPKKTGETVDRRQNNGSVKAVSPRHCPATCTLRNCFNSCAGQSPNYVDGTPL